MPANRQKAHCGYVSPDGRPCRAWAIRDSDPPFCSVHAGRNQKGGTSKEQELGAQSFYSTALLPEELADLLARAEDLSLDEEIAAARITLRRILALLSADRAGPMAEGATAPGGGAPDYEAPMSARDYARLARLALEGGRTIGRLLRDKRALSGEAADGLAGAISQAIDELSVEWGIDL